jgi:hypothetical protein
MENMNKPAFMRFTVNRVTNGFVVDAGYGTHVVETYEPGPESLREVFDLIEELYKNQYEAENGIATRAN